MGPSEGTAGKNQVTALVVESEAASRDVLVTVLERRGYRVQVCDTLAEGRSHFGHQPLIVTHANGSVGELRGFVEFVRQRSGESQPYILAVGTPDSPSVTNAAQLGLNDVLPMPLDREKLDLRIAAISHWLSRRGFPLDSVSFSLPSSQPPAPPMTAPPQPQTPFPRAETGPLAPPPGTAWTERLIDAVPQAMALFDRDMRYRAVNAAYLAAFGLDRASLLGRRHYEVFTQLHPSWKDLFDRALQGEAGLIDLDVFERADGSRDYVRWDVKPWPAGAKPPEGVILSQEIITDRVRAERRQQAERRIAASLIESDTLPMVAVALDGRILRTSPAARSWLGLQPTADGRQHWWTVYPDADEEHEKVRFLAATVGTNGTAPETYTPSPIQVSGSDHRLLHWTATVQKGATGAAEGWLFAGALVEPAPVPPPAAPAPPPPLRGHSQDLLDHLPFAVIRLNGTGDVILANQPSTALLGYAFDEHGVEGWLEKGCPDPSFREQVIREWREGVWRRQMTKVFSLMTAEGLLKEIEFRPRLLADGDLLLTLVDVTETRRSEDALRSSEVKFRALYHETPTGIALTDRSGSVVDANPAFERMVGRSRLELRRGTLAQFIHPDDAATRGPALTNLAFGERTHDPVAVRLVDRSGSELSVQLSASPVRNAAGECILTAYYAMPAASAAPEPKWDDTPALADAAGVWTSAAKNGDAEVDSVSDAAFRGLPTPLIVTDLRGRIVELNTAAERLFGYRSVELTGAGLYRLFQPDQPATFRKSVSDQINSRRHWQADVTYVKPNGTLGRCHAEIHPVLGPQKSGLLVCSVQASFEVDAATSFAPAKADAVTPATTATLSRPVRHALRNHLQLVGSLLHLQQRRIGDPAARAQLAATHERVRAIALVEEQILAGADPQALDMAHLMRALVDQRRSLLPASLHGPETRILFGPTPLETGLALPLILIANELLQVAIGPEAQPEPTDINLLWNSGQGTLIVRWIGDPNDLESSDGLEVARLLAEQIGGHLMFRDDGPAIQAEVHFHYASA